MSDNAHDLGKEHTHVDHGYTTGDACGGCHNDLKHTKAHPGFHAVEEKIAHKEGVSEERAGAILGAASRNASAAAHKANPRLNRVKG